MCTYDYTPYTGCEDGPQHYYIQWLKCGIAVEEGRYCSMDTSSKVEQLRKLSANVLSCPLHGPIAVQQFVLEPANQQPVDEDEPERSRARSSARRSAASRGRAPRTAGSDRDPEQPARRPVRKQRSRREMAPESSDSESSSSFSARRPRVANRGKRMTDREAMGRRRSRTPQASSHQRSISADIAPPPPLPLSMRHGRSEVSLPLRTDFEGQREDHQKSFNGRPQSRPKNSIDIPRTIGVVGLPSSPDMHHRGSVHRSRSEAGLTAGVDLLPELPVQKGPLSPASDSSPDQNPDMPFSTPGRRGRRTGPRSVRDRSVDTTMRRIDEHEVQDPETRNSTTTASPEPQHPTQYATAHIPHHRRSNSRPQLNNLQIPKNREPYQRDAYSAPTATPPETEISHPDRSIPRTRARSLRHIDTSPVSPTTILPPPQLPTHTSARSSEAGSGETASIRSTRSRRFEDQVAEGRKWAAAREHHIPPPPTSSTPTPPPLPDVLAHMSSLSDTNLPLGGAGVGVGVGVGMGAGAAWAGRGSVDSGYLSGHHTQRSWETVGVSSAAVSAAGEVGVGSGVGAGAAGSNGNGNGKGGRNTLHKTPPPSAQAQGQGAGLAHGGAPQQQQQQQQKRPVPAPLNLHHHHQQQHGGAGAGSGLPPCALPVSLMSPGFQSDADASSAGKGAKATLLQRMGLRRKFSGLVGWDKDRGGGREVGVEG
ncbi:uncharacterized protein B0H64DRAFT_363361 [Chaetomium fimeti]|uniref:Uncharacterized protein n=1 Tax=Chaetomium fimeti TaxID=1854472 RepID=A0AAE0HAQ2_9PEZI|nr:hypothetical protein B0H64DRAFT_363361 [Chaetomium fimeti]